jgi:GGDEF domain-containing protein
MGRLMAVSTFLLRKCRRFPLIALIGVVLFCLGLLFVNDSETAAARARDRKLINAKVEIRPETAERNNENKDVSIGAVTSVDHDDERIKMAVDKMFKVITTVC